MTFATKTLRQFFAMRRHRAGVHENAKHTCATCNAVFGDRDVLKEHVKGVHQREYRFICTDRFCGAKYRWRYKAA